ncbi:nitroreductase family protein [Candidatus Woesearchaeota archaeon]|nr:nitroreductase family protein [Candidatus Woesearchaeota archaeon]
MDVYECIKTRRTIRKFKDIEVPWDNVCKILEAGKSAPSAGNIQNWKFIVIKDKSAKSEIAEYCGNQLWIARASFLICVVADVDKARRFYGIRGERLYSGQNCAAAAENMLLMAHSLGVGGAWIGYMEEDKIISSLTLPKGIRPQCILAFGYPAENPPAPPKYTLENVMYFRQFGGQGNRIQDIPQYKGEFSYKIKGAIDKTKSFAQKLNEKLLGKDEK